MSAFQVQDTTINNILRGLDTIVSDGYLRRPMAELGYTNDCKGFDELGTAMVELNAAAVLARYEGRYPSHTGDEYRYNLCSINLVQAYKSLQCWLYQCSEGTVPETPLFKFFADYVQPALANRIISNLPDYEKASWD